MSKKGYGKLKGFKYKLKIPNVVATAGLVGGMGLTYLEIFFNRVLVDIVGGFCSTDRCIVNEEMKTNGFNPIFARLA